MQDDQDDDEDYEQGYYGFPSFAFSLEQDDLKGLLLLDNQAQNSIFCRADLITGLRDRTHPTHYRGVGQGSVVAYQEGEFLGLTVD